MQYRLHLNLQKRAALKSAISFWERKEVQNKIKEFFSSCSEFDHPVQYEWSKITQTVIDEWNKELLPQHLEIELIHITKMIGKTIFNWYQYIKHEYGAEEAINCIDKIHWTPYGTVDTIQVFKSSWLNNPNLDITKLYNFACSHMLEEHIDDLWYQIPQDIQVNSFLDIYVRFDRQLLAYWKHCRDGDLYNLGSYFEAIANDFDSHDSRVFNLIYDLNRSIEENMLRLSVYQGNFIATKYFWEKMTEEERNDSVLKSARIAVMRFNACKSYGKGIDSYKKSQYGEICIFLMNQMSKGHKKAFFNKKIRFDALNTSNMDKVDVRDEILKMLLFTWPWQELFMPVLNDMLLHRNKNSQMVCKFLDEITDEMDTDHSLNYPLKMSKYKSLLREAWLIIPASVKEKIVELNQDCLFIGYLIDAWDMDSLKLILDDSAIAASRNKLIEFGSDKYEDFIIDHKFERLNQLMEEILRSEEEKKEFKQKINIWTRFVIRDDFDLADKMLDWRCSTPEERQSVKSSIDHIDICDELLGMRDGDEYCYDLLNRFLDWKFNTEEEKRNCKNHFKNDEFSIPQVVQPWISCNKEKAKKESSLFLHWIMKSDEEIARFKKMILIKLETDQSVFDYAQCLRRRGIMRDFLYWCLFDDETI